VLKDPGLDRVASPPMGRIREPLQGVAKEPHATRAHGVNRP
jgi:hypothetical protein